MDKRVWHTHYPNGTAVEIEIPNHALHNILQETAANYPSKHAVSFFGKKMTYLELLGAVNRFAAALQKQGLKKGDRVAIMLPNCPQYVIAYYGVLTAGGIVTQINPMLMERELEHILSDSGSETIVMLDSLYPKLNAIQAKTEVKRCIVVSLQPSDSERDSAIAFEQFLSEGTVPVEQVLIEPEHDIAVLQYTGGTTGRSKGAMLTHKNLVANIYQTKHFFGNKVEVGTEKYLTVIPLFHVFAMTGCMNSCILMAGENILLPRFELEEVLNTIKQEKPSIFPGVPTMYVAINGHPAAETYGIQSIKISNSGSAPMPVEVMKEYENKTGSIIMEGFGLSEASPVTHCNPLFAERKPGSVGIGFPSTDYRIVDIATGKIEMPPGELGELVIKGPQVMKGYWNMPDETAVTLRDGWLYTGDLARMDEEGYVYIVDRKKDLIIASGYNVYPRDVEEVLYEHPAILEAVVIGVPDQYRGETVKAVVVLKEGMKVTEQEIMDYCRRNMAAYRVPRIIEFRTTLPKTNVGKILRRALREEAKA